MSENKTNILVVGAAGMLGTDLVELLRKRQRQIIEADLCPAKPEQLKLDITDSQAVEDLISTAKPTVVYNCSAFTDVDGAEENESLATDVNGRGAGHLARACKKNNALLVHVSTDYVFDGKAHTPYQPQSPTNPQTAYGRSKLTGETLIRQAAGHWIIVRTSWLYGRGGKNFIDTIVSLARQKDSLKIVNDQIGCPTYTVDLAHCLVDLAEKQAQGVFHFCNPPACSWYDLAKHAIQTAAVDCRVLPCSSSEFPRPAPRPAYSVLDCQKTFDTLGWTAQSWPQAVQVHLQS